MKQSQRLLTTVAFVAGMGIFLYGCAPPSFRAHPQFEARTRAIRSPGLLSPDVKIYEFTAGGVRELRDEWCAKGKENVQNAVTGCLRENLWEVKPIVLDKDLEEEMEDIYALYRAVSVSILRHTYGEFLFPEKVKNFDYSVGSLENITRRFGADALIFVYGFDEISTAGRKALTAAAVIAGAFTGVMIIPRGGITFVSVAVVEPAGTILWFNCKGGQGAYDLRDPESATELVRRVLSELPRFQK